MSSSQRMESLARRRANYQLQRQMRNEGKSSLFTDGKEDLDQYIHHVNIRPASYLNEKNMFGILMSCFKYQVIFLDIICAEDFSENCLKSSSNLST